LKHLSGMEDQYSCDEEELDQEVESWQTGRREGSLVSGSRTEGSRTSWWEGGRGGYYQLSGDEEEEDGRLKRSASSARSTYSRMSDQGELIVSGASQERDTVGWETSSQVARSILGGIFKGITSKIPEDEEEEEKRSHANENELEQIEIFSVSHVESVENISEVDDDSNPQSYIADKMADLDEANKSFSERMTDWINTVTLKQTEDSPAKIGDTNSRPVDVPQNAEENNDKLSNTVEDECSVKTFQQRSPARTLSTKSKDDIYFLDDPGSPESYESKENSIGYQETEILDNEIIIREKEVSIKDQYEDMDSSFHQMDRSPQGISYSMIPDIALASYNQGFSKAQITNGRELFENGLIRQRSGSGVRNLPFPETYSRPQYRKVVETTEQRLVVGADGTKTVDTTHRREQEERDGGLNQSWRSICVYTVCFLLLLLVLTLVTFTLVPGLSTRSLRCLIENGKHSWKKRTL